MEQSLIAAKAKRGSDALPAALATVARVVLSLVLLAAVIEKMMDPSLFLGFVSAVFGLGATGAESLFLFTICTEVLLGAALLLLRGQMWPLFSVGFLFLAFSGVIAYAMLADVAASCGCFGTFALEEEAKPLALARNLCLAAVALLVGVHKRRSVSGSGV